MAIRSDSPQVALLLHEVEKQYGRPVRTQSDFILLADRIETKTREHISDSTIKRLWVQSLAYETVSLRTLNVLSQYAEFGHYEAFLKAIAENGLVESELVSGKDSIKSEDLRVGDILVIAWMPDRECRIKYLGNRKFEAVECHNSTLQKGDIFYCSNFIKGRKLYVDNLTQGDIVHESYGMGTQHGLTRVELESPKD